MNCPICNSKMNIFETLEKKTNTPNILKNKVDSINYVSIPFYKCSNCGHGYIENILSDDFYEEFTVAIDDNSGENRRNERVAVVDRLMNKLLELNNGDNDSILEIGSGRGFLLDRARKYYKRVLGVEPSKVEAEAAQKLGLDIIVDFFDRHNNIGEQFSSIVSTMVFEHLPDPKEAIIYAYDLLKWGGCGVIQVPNALRTYINKVYFDVYPQHLHYFTPLSLAKLIQDAGLEIVSLEETGSGSYLEVYFRKPEIKDTFYDKEKEDKNFFDRHLVNYKNIGLWGASYAARGCMRLINEYHIRHFFDISSSKVGGYINDCSLQIEYPEEETVNSCDVIIILANEYTSEILTALKNKYDYKGNVIFFDDNCNLKMK